VDHDWNLPIGYAFLTADELEGWERYINNVAFWARREAVRFEPHLFYKGQGMGISLSGASLLPLPQSRSSATP
jgi:hypothetical protein